MSPTDRTLEVILLTILLVTSGCLGTLGGDDRFLSVRHVDSVPDQAEVTPLDNETVQQSPILVDAVTEIKNRNRSTVGRQLSKSEYRQIQRIGASIPTYESSNETGTYIRAGNTTVTFVLYEQS